MKRSIGWLGRAISFFVYHAPLFARHALARGLAILWFDVLRIRRRVILGNLAIAFPEMPPAERARLARRSLFHQGMNLVEYSYFPFLDRPKMERLLLPEGLDVVEEALAGRKGALLLTLHMGNGDLAACGLATLGLPMVMVSKAFKLKWLNDLWFGMRERLGLRFIPARDSSFALLKSLKQNRLVAIPLDQFTGPPIGVRTTFFGKETGTAAGLAVMSERSGAPVVLVYTWRNDDGTHGVRFERIPQPAGREAERVTQEFNGHLERLVRERPEQWMWLHKRWKRFVVH